MKRHLTVVLCAFALAGVALAQDSTNKPAAAWSAKEMNRQPRRSLETRASGPVLVPVGTAIRIRLERPLSTSRNHVGDKFYGHVTEPVRVNERTLIRRARR